MYRLFALAGLLGLAVVVSTASVKAEDDKKPKDIGEIMKKAHQGESAFRAAVAKALRAKDFDKARTTTKAWVAIAGHLGTFDPPKGEKESWKKLTKSYAETVKSLDKAVADKEAKEAGAALKKIITSCKTCHTAHRE
jgi:hypothetical protein